MGGRQKRGDQTAARILDAALSLYRETGSTAIAVASLVERSGMPIGSLYHHFGSRDGVAAALYARCLGALLEHIARALKKTASPAQIIGAIVRAYLTWTRDHRAEAAFIYASAFEPYSTAPATDIQSAHEGPRAAIVSLVRSAAASGDLVTLPDFLYEMLIIGPVAETARRWLAGDPTIDLAKAMRELPGPILRSLTAVRDQR